MFIKAVPLLPCASIDEMADFYALFGFATTYRQVRPNPYLALSGHGLDLHYFGMDDFAAEDSYGSCVVLVEDTEPAFDLFAAGLRASYGKLPLTGFPRITRPRRRKNAGGLSGFSLIDPAGNWIRIIRDASIGGPEAATGSKLSDALANAVVIADSHGDAGQALKILSGAVAREQEAADPVDVVEALAFLAELAVRAGDADRAREALDRIRALELLPEDAAVAAQALAQADELRAHL